MQELLVDGKQLAELTSQDDELGAPFCECVAVPAWDDVAAGKLLTYAPINRAILVDVDLNERSRQVFPCLRPVAMLIHPGQKKDTHRAVEIHWDQHKERRVQGGADEHDRQHVGRA